MKVNYHTHCKYCDGKGEPVDYVIEAINRGFSSIGFSSHAPLKEENNWTLKDDDLDNYLKEINSLKTKFRNKIKIYVGLEIDFYPDENRFLTFKKCNLDYSIGSVHMLKPSGFNKYYSIDESKDEFENVLKNVFKGSIKDFTICYFTTLRALITQGGFNILGHIDLIKKFNKDFTYFTETEDWYKTEVLKTLDFISTTNIIVEMNTGALSRGVHDTPYPSFWILEECKKRDIKICLNSDAHAANNLECYFEESIKILKKCGYNKLYTPFEIIDIGSYYG